MYIIKLKSNQIYLAQKEGKNQQGLTTKSNGGHLFTIESLVFAISRRVSLSLFVSKIQQHYKFIAAQRVDFISLNSQS